MCYFNCCLRGWNSTVLFMHLFIIWSCSTGLLWEWLAVNFGLGCFLSSTFRNQMAKHLGKVSGNAALKNSNFQLVNYVYLFFLDIFYLFYCLELFSMYSFFFQTDVINQNVKLKQKIADSLMHMSKFCYCSLRHKLLNRL